MSSATFTETRTYTAADVARVVSCFAADYDVVRESTGLHADTAYADKVVADVQAFAVNGYLNQVDLALYDGVGRELRAAAYTSSSSATGWDAQRPGGCIWPRTPNGELHVVISYSRAWEMLGRQGRASFQRQRLLLSWTPSTIDLDHPGLAGTPDRLYASAAYGMSRVSYR